MRDAVYHACVLLAVLCCATGAGYEGWNVARVAGLKCGGARVGSGGVSCDGREGFAT